ncbi:DUF58 domain-containing protein [Glaciihabitans arcticus]|uniref:DUF58 domain-containing protein n=1 Tax=Glaciihabitans arcticus TaxID=2668039 RepID=A0A4Q9GN76_9MICO|nr:DUF58 domain-containing protein [Glaciihabitans arcticus]TBN56105.1 DUF58 domain-containing protein [Glaciihabitans arcticus]
MASSKKAATRTATGKTTLTVRGRLFVAASIGFLVAAFALGNTVLLLASFLTATLVIIGRLLMRARTLELDAVRTFNPPNVAVGDTTRATLVITNRARSKSATARWQDGIPWGKRRTEMRVLPALTAHTGRYANSGTSARFSYELTPPRRGVFEIGPLSVVTGDPFGLVVGTVSLAGTHSLFVTPPVVDLSGNGMPLEAGDGSSRVIQRSTSGSDDDLMTREYRRGDALRRVHWRASARYGELMVRQEEQRSRPEVRLLFDTRGDGYRDVSTDAPNRSSPQIESESFEWVVRLVASLGVHLEASGFSVATIESGGQQVSSPAVSFRGSTATGDHSSAAFLESLAGVRLVRDDFDGFDHYQPDTAAPVFAVLCQPSDATIDWAIAHRRAFEPGIAVILQTGLPMMRDLLNPEALSTRAQFEAAGWQCIEAEPNSSAADVWAELTAVHDGR